MRARALAICAALLGAAALCFLALKDGGLDRALWSEETSPAAAAVTSEELEIEKFVSGGGDCGLGTFIRAMPCSRDLRSGACCHGLRGIFANGCACKSLPNIVMSHGGSTSQFMIDYMQCEFSDDAGTPPVDHVSKHHVCVDQQEWCADRIHNIDVRLTAFYLGMAQMHDSTQPPKGGWVYVHASEADRLQTATTMCKALGFEGAPKLVGESVSPQPPSKQVSCTAEAALKGDITKCKVSEIGATSCDGAPCPALRMECVFNSGPARPQFCTRVGQRGIGRNGNRLLCEPSSSGTTVLGHSRRLGAAHAICGTAGINETRIQWYDGYQDDYFAYSATRLANGHFQSFALQRDELHGEDLLTSAELEIGARRSALLAFEEQTQVKAALHEHLESVGTGEVWS